MVRAVSVRFQVSPVPSKTLVAALVPAVWFRDSRSPLPQVKAPTLLRRYQLSVSACTGKADRRAGKGRKPETVTATAITSLRGCWVIHQKHGLERSRWLRRSAGCGQKCSSPCRLTVHVHGPGVLDRIIGVQA